MNDDDTIVAVSSAGAGPRSIVRLSGAKAFDACRAIFTPTSGDLPEPGSGRRSVLASGRVHIEPGLAADGWLYLFFPPHSYTGEMVAELHVNAAAALVDALLQKLLARGLHMAAGGEFTARAYLNGKLDLAQAEAVNEIIAGSNRFQLDAAQRLLGGRLAQTTRTVCAALVDLLSEIEAGLDFSSEDITFISTEEAVARLNNIAGTLHTLLTGSVRYETLIDLPAVGIAGAPNAGKSSLLNTLLGHERSIVSQQRKTTRDVLSGVVTIDHFQCVLFDCAGLLAEPDNILDRLAQQAAIEALNHCHVVVFCVDAATDDWSEDRQIRSLVHPSAVLYTATKVDRIAPKALGETVARMTAAFHADFLPISATAGKGLDQLRTQIAALAIRSSPQAVRDTADGIALTSRHKQAIGQAIENVTQAAEQITTGDEEVAAMIIRAAHRALAEIEQEPIDEQLLDRIFGRFCIGK